MKTAKALGLAENQVRAIAPDVGGGLGDLHLATQGRLVRPDILEHQKGRHELRHARRIARRVGSLFREHHPGRGVDADRAIDPHAGL